MVHTPVIHCADINLCHSDLFPSQTELMVIGHHHTYVRPKLKSSNILSDGPVKDILRPGGGGEWGTAPPEKVENDKPGKCISS